MALVDEIPIISPHLNAIPGVKYVTNGWPEDWEKLPCISISEASNVPAIRYANKTYADELEYYIRIWTNRAAEKAPIASAVDDVMTALGYERTMTYDDDSADAKQKAMRYRKYV
jgi:hypothetical protein